MVVAPGVTSTKRVALLADIPTLDEAGVKAFEVTQWFGVFAPSSASPEVVARVQREIAAILREPDHAQRTAAEGSEAVANAPADFRRVMRTEYAAWDAVIRKADIRAE